MIFYEVNLIVNQMIKEAYVAWLSDHLQEMLQFDGFKKVSFSEEIFLDAKVLPADNAQFTVLYEIESYECLQNYLQNHAARMRQDGIDKFGDKFSATRRVFNLLRSEKK